MELKLDREKNGQTDAVSLCLCLKISIAELVHLFGKGEMLAELLEMMGRKMVGNENCIVARLLKKPYLLNGRELRAGGYGICMKMCFGFKQNDVLFSDYNSISAQTIFLRL
jgi:hypothetical protein